MTDKPIDPQPFIRLLYLNLIYFCIVFIAKVLLVQFKLNGRVNMAKEIY